MSEVCCSDPYGIGCDSTDIVAWFYATSCKAGYEWDPCYIFSEWAYIYHDGYIALCESCFWYYGDYEGEAIHVGLSQLRVIQAGPYMKLGPFGSFKFYGGGD